jgi:tetratricopeptide (TPR) repeat protein
MTIRWQIGDTIKNRWKILRIIKGGMGIVYIVNDLEVNEIFAAKTFQDEIFTFYPEIADRFSQEALIWVNLDSHQNVTEARFVDVIDRKPFLFLEHISGGNLNNWVGTKRLTEDLMQVIHFAIQLCDGMNHAISKGIKAHRDIKPGNCLITQDGTLKLTDFGLVKMFDDIKFKQPVIKELNNQQLSIGFTQTGAVIGTPPYMAPEQFGDPKHVDIRADIYSIGVMLFQMATGELPFKGRTWEDFEILHKTQPLTSLSSHLSMLHTVIYTCLAKKPDDRYPSIGYLREELADIYQRFFGKPFPQPATEKELDATKLSNKAASLYSMGQLTEALTFCERALILNPRDGKILTNKGMILRKLGRYEEAIESFDRALTINPHLALAWSDKGLVLGEGFGNWEQALFCLDNAIKNNPYYVEAWCNKGNALCALKRHKEGLTCYDQSIELNPRYERAWVNKGVALAALGQYEEAIACYGRALELTPLDARLYYNMGEAQYAMKRADESIACFERALELDSSYAAAWYDKGAVLVNAFRNYSEALICFQEAKRLGLPQAVEMINLCQKNLGRDSKAMNSLGDSAEDLLATALELTYSQKTEEALKCYDRVLEINQNSVEAWYSKGVTLGRVLRYDEAIACYDHALKINPDFAEAWQNKGTMLDALGKVEEALLCYDRALQINQHFVEAWYNKGNVLEKLERYEEAIKCYNCALENNVSFASAWYNKGNIFMELEKYDEAISCYEHCIELNPDDVKAWSNKGAALIRMSKYKPALACLDRALKINPKHADAWFNKGTNLTALGRIEEALKCFDRFLELNPNHAYAWFTKGNTFTKINRYTEALECFEKAQRLGIYQAVEAAAHCRKMLGLK